MDDTPGIADALCRLGTDPSPDNWRRVAEGAWPLIAGSCYKIADRRGDDAVQEALLHVRAGARRFHPHGSDADGEARRWLRRVACTSALELLRRERRRRTHACRAWPATELPAPDHASSMADNLTLLRLELAELREPDRTAVALHHLEGQDLDSVGRTLGCTPEAARKRIERALATLRSRLAGRGVALGLAAIATALREAPAATVPATPSVTALELIGSPLAPTTSITLASGVALMATTAGCASAILATVLAWNYATGADQVPAPTVPPVRPPAVGPVQPATGHWLDAPLQAQIHPDAAVLGQAANQLTLWSGHPVFCDASWFIPGRRENEPLAIDGRTTRAVLDELNSTLNARWLLIEDQVAILPPEEAARLQLPVAPLPDSARTLASPDGPTTVVLHLQKATGLNLVIDPGMVAAGQDVDAAGWTTPTPAVQVMSQLAQANHWTWTLRKDAIFLQRAPGIRPLLEKDDSLVIRGRPWTRPLLDKPITLEFRDAGSAQVVDELTRQTGVTFAWRGTWDGAITLRMHQLRARDALRWIAQMANHTLTESEIGKVVEFVPTRR